MSIIQNQDKYVKSRQFEWGRLGTEKPLAQTFEETKASSGCSTVEMDGKTYWFFNDENKSIFVKRNDEWRDLCLPKLLKEAADLGLKVMKFDGRIALLKRR